MRPRQPTDCLVVKAWCHAMHTGQARHKCGRIAGTATVMQIASLVMIR